MTQFFEDEEELRNLLIEWLEDSGLFTKKSFHVGRIEIDVVAKGNKRLTSEGFINSGENYLYSFETKIATSSMLVRDVVEQAITRLLITDYVYIVVPKEAEIWVSDVSKEKKYIPDLIIRRASGVYSRNIGIISMKPNGEIEIARIANRSSLVIPKLKNYVLRGIKGFKGVGGFN